MTTTRTVTVQIVADVTRFQRALWRSWYAIVRHRRQDPDPNPFPHISLFRRSAR